MQYKIIKYEYWMDMFIYLFLGGIPCIITERPKNTNWPYNWAWVSLPIADTVLAPCIEPNRKLQSP